MSDRNITFIGFSLILDRLRRSKIISYGLSSLWHSLTTITIRALDSFCVITFSCRYWYMYKAFGKLFHLLPCHSKMCLCNLGHRENMFQAPATHILIHTNLFNFDNIVYALHLIIYKCITPTYIWPFSQHLNTQILKAMHHTNALSMPHSHR